MISINEKKTIKKKIIKRKKKSISDQTAFANLKKNTNTENIPKKSSTVLLYSLSSI